MSCNDDCDNADDDDDDDDGDDDDGDNGDDSGDHDNNGDALGHTMPACELRMFIVGAHISVERR